MWRFSGDWMVIWDDRILEILFNEGTGTPTEIAKKEGIAVGRSHITKRLSKLADKGLCEDLGNGVYRLNTEAIGYLFGQFDVENNEWIGIADVRATFSPSPKFSNRWAFVPEHAEMYESNISEIEKILSKMSNVKYPEGEARRSDSQEFLAKSEQLVTSESDTSKEQFSDNIAESSGVESNEFWAKRIIEEQGIENAKKRFPDFDFTKLDDTNESNTESDEN